MTSYLSAAVLLAATLAQPAFANPVDSAAAQQAKQIRQDVEAKQKALAEDARVQAPAPAAPAAPLDLPIDHTDSPGSTTK
jgi:hemolysin activation/secretion protein